MSSRRRYRTMWVKQHDTYERQAYKEFARIFKKWAKEIPFDQLNSDNYKYVIRSSMDLSRLDDLIERLYVNIGLKQGNRVGRYINKEELKEFDKDKFQPYFLSRVQVFLQEYGAVKVKEISNTYRKRISALIQTRLAEGLTIPQVASEVQKIAKSRKFYKWEALRIARTETTAAANFGAVKSGEITGYIMEKEWISADDSRVRRKPESKYSHRAMDGKTVGVDEDFVFNEGNPQTQDRLSYPADPKGAAGNVINCRCTVAIVPKRDDDGNLIRAI